MRALAGIVCASLLLAAVGVRAEEGDEPVGEVLVLNDNNFQKIVPEHDLLLVEFYAPWCGHCKNLEPKYNEAAKLLAENEETKNIRIAKIDADSQKQSGGKYGVSGFPTIKLFRHGEVSEDFEGDRTAEGIVEYMKKKSQAATNKEITQMDALRTLVKPQNVLIPTVVGYFADKAGVDYKIFKQVVTQFAGKGVDVYHTATPSVLEGMGFYSSGSAIYLYRPLAKPFKMMYKGTLFKQKLKDWILTNSLPTVGIYSPDTEKLYQLVGSKVIRFVAEEPSKNIVVKNIEDLARHVKKEENVKFGISDIQHYKADVDAQCAPGVKICVLAQNGGNIYGMQEEYTEDNVETFIQNFLANKLKAKVKSEPAPAAHEAGEVAVVVGSTFESHMDSDKDILLEFYAPWCGHCKALAPKYDELAKELKDKHDTITIAKFDMTANDIPKPYGDVYKVEGFPTLYFSKKGARMEPLQYEGAREVADLKKYVLGGGAEGAGKSEEAPEPKMGEAGKVAVVVGSTFDEWMESNKDILFEFYAPWCGHCKNLAPKYDQLAGEVADQFDSLVIAKMDATANDIPKKYKGAFQVSGFPTLYFSKTGSRSSPVKYSGAREVSDFKSFLEKNKSK